MNCIYLGAEKASCLSLPHIPICVFTLFTNITIPGTLRSGDTVKGYTWLLTVDSVMMPLRWKLLSSAPHGRDMMTDKECVPSPLQDDKCNVLVKPSDYIRLPWLLNPSFERYIISDRNKKWKGQAILTFPFPTPYVFQKLWQPIFLDLFVNKPDGLWGSFYATVWKLGEEGPSKNVPISGQ